MAGRGQITALAVLVAGVACTTPDPPPRGAEPRSPTNVPDVSDPLVPLADLPVPPPKTPEERAARLAFPYLDGEVVGASVSIGDTTHGRLVNGKEIVESSALKILPRQKERDLRYGTDGLVGLLDHAARALHERSGTPMWIGNVGKREGGDIEWSVSHNAGRDADVAFCYRDPVTGRPVDPPDLVVLDNDGLSKDRKLAFDAPRTWMVVRAMIEFQGASLQYLFISGSLKKRLLDHAKLTKEPAWVIDRANELLRQPGNAAPHDDHLHVRIYCSAMDASGGCHDMGLNQPFAVRFDAQRAKAAERARKQLASSIPDKRRAGLLRLGLVGDPIDLPAAVHALEDQSAGVRAAAAEMIAALGTDKDTPALVARFRVETDALASASLVEAIGFLGGKDAGPFFRDVLLATASAQVLGFSPEALPLDAASAPFFFHLATDPYPPMRSLLAPEPVVDLTFDRAALQRLSVTAVRHTGTTEPIEPLIKLLDVAQGPLALEAAESLAYLTNQRLFDERGLSPLPDRLRDAKAGYLKLFSMLGKSVRDGWLINGFSSRGYKVKSLDRRSAWELLRAVADEPHLSYNARTVLARLLDQPKEVVNYGTGDGCRLLYGRLLENRSSLHLDRPTEEQKTACMRARAKEKDEPQTD